MSKALFISVLLLGVGIYFLLFDGAIPAKSDYQLNIIEIRGLANAPQDQLPTRINTEVLARSPAPYAVLRAGGAWNDAYMTRSVFQIETPAGNYLIEAGMDEDLAIEYGQADNFSHEAWARIQSLMSSAKGIVVTHEHPDHMGGLVRHSDPDLIAPKATITKEQAAGLARLSESGKPPAEFATIDAIELTSPQKVAPGIVLIPAKGHTPGSIMIYVALVSGQEFLFIGDIAYTESNIRDGVDRTRLLRFFMHDPEDRSIVIHQVSTLHKLYHAEPNITIIPAHADLLLTRLMDEKVIHQGFRF